MASTARDSELRRVCPLHHGASVPPAPAILQEFIRSFFPSLAKEGWREAPGWFDPGGGDLMVLLKVIRGSRHDESGGRTPLGIDRRWSHHPVGKVDGLRSASSGVQSNNYWSSTTNASNTGNAWNVNLNDGNVNANDKTNNNYVWPVRGGA